jgi:hypothetical protein
VLERPQNLGRQGLIPCRYEHTVLTACTQDGYAVRDRIAALE